jgi:hypothetical protein
VLPQIMPRSLRKRRSARSPPPARPERCHDPEATLIAVKSPGSAGTDSDPEVAAVVRLLHRRRGWIVTTVVGVAAWLTVAVMRGSLAPNGGYGEGVAVGSVTVVLLTIGSIVALAACVVDTVRLHRVDSGVRQRAGQRTAHYPARAHPYSYPPRHRLDLILSSITLLILLGIGVAVLPVLVNGVAYLTGAENSSVFLPLSYSQECGRSGCSTVTDGTLASGASVNWPRRVPLGQEFPVREPVWDWGFGAGLINDDAAAIAAVVLGVLADGFCVLLLVFLVILAHRWGRHQEKGRHARAAGR